ncbi:hypothetical protein ACKKBG_A34605 [Auxenochlorella protothecoides x Auxenochlorella symbiontica]
MAGGSGPRTSSLGALVPTTATSLLLLAAFINQGVIGLAILIFAEVWSVLLAPLASRARAIGTSKQLWRGLTGLTWVIALLTLASQLAYTTNVPALETVLRLLGLTRVTGARGLFQATAPIVLTLTASWLQLKSLNALQSSMARQSSEGFELLSLTQAGLWTGQRAPGTSLTTSDTLCLLCLAAAAAAAPCLLTLPLLLGLAWLSWRGSGMGGGAPGPTLALQLYAGAILLLHYAWQLGLHRIAALGSMAQLLGVVDVGAWGELGAATRLRCLALLALFAAAGAVALQRGSGNGGDGGQRRGSTVLRALGRVLPTTSVAVAHLLVGLVARPAVLSSALVGLALVQPSLAGAAFLLASLPGLIADAPHASPGPLAALALGLQAWAAVCHVATSLLPLLDVGRILRLLGVIPLTPEGHAAGVLAATLCLAAGAAAVAGRAALQRYDRSGAGGDDASAPLLATHAPTEGASAPAPAPPPASTVSPVRVRASAPWRATRAAALAGAWYLGFGAVGAAQFCVGVSRYDLAHALYLLGALWTLGRRAARLRPRLAQEGGAHAHAHALLRVGLAAHTAAVYAAWLARAALPGAAWLRWRGWSWLGVGPGLGAREALPLLGLAALAAAHDALGRRVEASRDPGGGPPRSLLLDWQYPGTAWLSHAAVAYGPALVCLAVYILLLVDCDLSLLGLLYLCIGLSVLVWQPRKGRWVKAGPDLVLDGSPLPRWVPLALLALLALADALCQLAARAVLAAPWWHVPENWAAFARDVLGIATHPSRRELAARLLRPLAVLACLAVYRWLFALGTLRRQLEGQVLGPEGVERERLTAQYGLLGFLKRLLILHASKLIVVACFAASMQLPGAIGALIICGVVAIPPLLWAQRLAPGETARMYRTLLAIQLVAGAWTILQYSVEIAWVQGLIDLHSLRAWVAWLGLEAGDPSQHDTGHLQRLLTWKVLVLVTVAAKRRSLKWKSQLPAAVRSSRVAGAACPLFWPPTPEDSLRPGLDPREEPRLSRRAAGLLSPRAFLAEGTAVSSLAGSARAAAAEARATLRRWARSALDALDWPRPAPLEASAGPAVPRRHTIAGTPTRGRSVDARPFAPLTSTRGSSPPGPSATGLSSPAPPPPLPVAGQWRAFRFALQDWLESSWQRWNMDLCLLLLLLTAFQATTALALVHVALLGLVMALAPARRTQACRWVLVPALGVMLAGQYSVLVGLPPPLPVLKGANDARHDLLVWLGLKDVSRSALWLLFLAYSTAVLQMRYAEWLALADRSSTQRAQREGRAAAAAQAAEASWLLMGNPGDVQQDALPGSLLWQPLTLAAQPAWRWADWARFWMYRHYLEFLLVAVVALCTLENDVIHAGYLALALLFFRQRIALRAAPGRLFWWLPLYNMAVLVITLIYQIPFETWFSWQIDPDVQACNLAHLLGLYKTSVGGSLLGGGYRGAAADVVLWVLIRFQTHLFATTTYQKVMVVVAEEEKRHQQTLSDEEAAWKLRQAAAAVEASRQRAARAQRVARLKEGVGSSFASFGVGVSPTSLDFAFLEGETQEEEVKEDEEEEGEAWPPAEEPVEETTAGDQVAAEPTEERVEGAASPPTSVAAGAARRADSALTIPDSDYVSAGSSGEEGVPAGRASGGGEGVRAAVESHPVEPASASEEESTAKRGSEARDSPPPAASPPQQLPGPALGSRPAHTPATDYERELSAVEEEEARACGMAVDRRGSPGAGQGTASESASGTAAAASQPVSLLHRALQHLRHRLRRLDRESVVAYLAYVAVFVADYSLLALFFPLSMFVYALCSVKPTPRYWRVTLVYSELLIIVQYAYQIPTRLGCSFVTPQLQFTMEVIGIHASSVACIPLFVVYLVTLMHSYTLTTRHGLSPSILGGPVDGRGSVGATEQAPPPPVCVVSCAEGKAPHTSTDLEAGGTAGARGETPAQAPDTSTPGQAPSAWGHLRLAATSAAACLAEFALQACTVCERPPHHVIVQLRVPRALRVGREESESADDAAGEAACAFLQSVLDARRAEEVCGSAAGRSVPAAAGSGTPRLRLAHVNEEEQPAEVPADAPLLAAMGPLVLRYVAVLNMPAGTPPDQLAVLMEVVPQHSTHSAGGRTWPLRALSPGAAVTAVLAREAERGSGRGAVPEETPVVLAAEHHSRQSRDWYAITAAIDFVAFIYVALFYNKVVASARSLSEITNEHVVPLGYLVTLITLFMLIVLDRLFYTVGSPLGKAMLHCTQMAVFFSYCLSLFWSPATSGRAHAHLRTLVALKCISFAMSALQLRTGYPPPASYRNGMGRHTFVFMRRINIYSSAAFQVFVALPFVYELRQLLDWSCTPTTLTFMDWLKLEDINMSLYFVTVLRRSRAAKPPGQRQPRYSKFFQGTLLFVGLLLLLWVPLLVFSSGNPTYQVPAVVGFGVNVTLVGKPVPGANAKHRTSTRSFPLFAAGDRRVAGEWGGDQAMLGPGMTDYEASQFQLLCASPDADAYWQLPAPGRRSLINMLSDNGTQAQLSFGWTVQRDVPPLSDHGGPLCVGSTSVTLAESSRQGLLALLRDGPSDPVPLLRSNDPGAGEGPGASAALYPRFWHMRGDVCSSQPLASNVDGMPGSQGWDDQWVACNVSLGREREGEGMGGAAWWRFDCGLVDAGGAPFAEHDAHHCSKSFLGPQLVSVLDRVQGGFIGQTLSKFGIAGLYTVFVYGIGRFLRLSMTNIRMRIPYEDLPNTRRLVALCQDIYIARAEGELGLEEELYWALINIYRLPSVMFELTKREKLE